MCVSVSVGIRRHPKNKLNHNNKFFLKLKERKVQGLNEKDISVAELPAERDQALQFLARLPLKITTLVIHTNHFILKPQDLLLLPETIKYVEFRGLDTKERFTRINALAMIHYEIGNKIQSLELFAQSLAHDPNDEQALNYMAKFYWEEKQLEKAENSLEQVLAKNPNNAFSLLLMIKVQLDLLNAHKSFQYTNMLQSVLHPDQFKRYLTPHFTAAFFQCLSPIKLPSSYPGEKISQHISEKSCSVCHEIFSQLANNGNDILLVMPHSLPDKVSSLQIYHRFCLFNWLGLAKNSRDPCTNKKIDMIYQI